METSQTLEACNLLSISNLTGDQIAERIAERMGLWGDFIPSQTESLVMRPIQPEADLQEFVSREAMLLEEALQQEEQLAAEFRVFILVSKYVTTRQRFHWPASWC